VSVTTVPSPPLIFPSAAAGAEVVCIAPTNVPEPTGFSVSRSDSAAVSWVEVTATAFEPAPARSESTSVTCIVSEQV
jgi:hypothetical protein